MLSKCQINYSIAHKIKQLYYKIIAFAIENSYCNFYYTNIYNEDYVSNIGGHCDWFTTTSSVARHTLVAAVTMETRSTFLATHSCIAKCTPFTPPSPIPNRTLACKPWCVVSDGSSFTTPTIEANFGCLTAIVTSGTRSRKLSMFSLLELI